MRLCVLYCCTRPAAIVLDVFPTTKKNNKKELYSCAMQSSFPMWCFVNSCFFPSALLLVILICKRHEKFVFKINNPGSYRSWAYGKTREKQYTNKTVKQTNLFVFQCLTWFICDGGARMWIHCTNLLLYVGRRYMKIHIDIGKFHVKSHVGSCHKGRCVRSTKK